MTAETKHILRVMNDDAMKPRAAASIVSSFDPEGVIQAGAHVANDRFSNLVVSISWKHPNGKLIVIAHGSGATEEEQEAEGREGCSTTAERATRPHLPMLRKIRVLVSKGVQTDVEPARGLAKGKLGRGRRSAQIWALCQLLGIEARVQATQRAVSRRRTPKPRSY